MGVKEDMEAASEAASDARGELQAERAARTEAEDAVQALRAQLQQAEQELAAATAAAQKPAKPAPKSTPKVTLGTWRGGVAKGSTACRPLQQAGANAPTSLLPPCQCSAHCQCLVAKAKAYRQHEWSCFGR